MTKENKKKLLDLYALLNIKKYNAEIDEKIEYANELKEYIGVRLYSVTENAKGYPSLDVRCYSDALVGAKDDYVWYIAVPNSASKIEKLFTNSL